MKPIKKLKNNAPTSLFIMSLSVINHFLVNISLVSTAHAAELEEVVVTATKRATSIQDIAFAITALDADSLAESGIDNLEGYASLVPGLTIAGQGDGKTQISMRGINSGEVRRDNPRASESVGIYFGEIPLSAVLYNPDLDPYDLQRVEVLRGPQGTLYGSGSLAGTIRLIPNDPELSEFESSVTLDLSTIADGDTSHSLKGYINVPLIVDELAARVIAYSNDKGGWMDNVSPTIAGGDDVNSSTKQGARAAFLWQPTQTLTLKPTFIYQTFESKGIPVDMQTLLSTDFLVNADIITIDQVPDVSGDNDQFLILPRTSEDNVSIVNLVASVDFENTTLVSSTSYSDREIVVQVDFTMDSAFNDPSMFGGKQSKATPLLDWKDITSISQEIRLQSNSENNMQWIVGVFYSEIKIDYLQKVTSYDPAVLNDVFWNQFDVAPGDTYVGKQDVTMEQTALFGELIYDITDKLTATIGVRAFDYTQDFVDSTFFLGQLPPSSITTSEDDFNPKVLLSYNVSDDLLISAQVSQGFRLGGAQTVVPLGDTPGSCTPDIQALGLSFDPNGYSSETLWNYELTVKSSFPDTGVHFNTSVFHMIYKDLQIATRLGCAFTLITNTGEATAQGLEIEYKQQLTDKLLIAVSGAYTDTELQDDLPSGEALAGDEMLFSSDLSLSAVIEYSSPINDYLNGFVNITYQYTGDREGFYSKQYPGVDLPTTLDAYHSGNLRIGARSNNWDISVYINNFLDSDGQVYVDQETRAYYGYSRIQPRTIGLTGHYNF